MSRVGRTSKLTYGMFQLAGNASHWVSFPWTIDSGNRKLGQPSVSRGPKTGAIISTYTIWDDQRCRLDFVKNKEQLYSIR